MRKLEINGTRKLKKLQSSKKKSERVRGNLRIIAPMTVSAGAGSVSGVKSVVEEVRKRTHAAGQIAPARSITKDIKSGIKKIKKKFTKK